MLVIAIWFFSTSQALSAVDEGRAPTLTELTADTPVAAATLSSDGKWLSSLLARDGKRYLVIQSISSDGTLGVPFEPGFERHDIAWMSWVGGGQLILLTKSDGAFQLKRISMKDRTQDMLLTSRQMSVGGMVPMLVAPLADDPKRILLAIDGVVYNFPTVYELRLDSLELTEVVAAQAPIVRWFAGPDGYVGLGIGYRGRRRIVMARAKGESAVWWEINTGSHLEDPAFEPISIDRGGQSAVILSGAFGDTHALARVSLIQPNTDGTPKQQLIAQHDRYDIMRGLFHPSTGQLTGAYYRDHGGVVLPVDDGYRAVRKTVQSYLGHVNFELPAVSLNGDRWLVRVVSETIPPHHYIYIPSNDSDPDVFKRLTPTGLDKAVTLQASRKVQIPMKHGPPMEGLLTLARDNPSGTRKAVMLLHGGPVRRDYARWQPLVQLLASRGYAVLQPNFRGSSGYGDKWRKAGYGEWGGIMQDDVARAAKWMMRRGLVDKKHLCAAGGSYGGYAALMAVVKNPKLFRCAASMNGVTSIIAQVEHFNLGRFSALTVPRIQADHSRRSLAKASPLYYAKKIKRPVLLVAGTDDTTVPVGQSQAMAEELSSAGGKHKFVWIEGAGHSLEGANEKAIYYQALLEFLSIHLSDSAP